MSPVSTAGLLEGRARVIVGPPLFARAPSAGFALDIEKPQVAALSRLGP